MATAAITELLVTLARAYRHGAHRRHPAYGAISAARERLLAQPEARTSLAAIAAEAGYSVSRFCVLYRTFFGLPPIEELLRARLDRAAALLRYGGVSVTATAERCGFSSLHYFSRCFKERYGVPPSQYTG
jgi:AraC family transcriptional regulator